MRLAVLALTLSAIVPAAQANAQSVNVPPAIHSRMPALQDERFVRDLHDKNIEDVLKLYTPHAVFIDPDGHTFKGSIALRKLYEQVTSAFDSDLHLQTTSLKQTYKAAIEHGTFTETLHNRSTGATQHLSGTYVFLHEKQSDGQWLIGHMQWTQAPLH